MNLFLLFKEFLHESIDMKNHLYFTNLIMYKDFESKILINQDLIDDYEVEKVIVI